MTDPFTQFAPALESVTAFHKANLSAALEAHAVFVKGFQEIGRELVAQYQTHMETATALTKAALSAKTLHEVVERQVDGAKTGYEALVAGTTKLGELGAQVANDAFAPLKARAAAAAEALMKPVAA